MKVESRVKWNDAYEEIFMACIITDRCTYRDRYRLEEGHLQSKQSRRTGIIYRVCVVCEE